MSDHFYKDKLYLIQDSVLRCLEMIKTPFYLTGGTALSRYYLAHRYSDDLDFFQNQSKNFKSEVQNVINQLQSNNFSLDVQTFDESFVRLFIREKDTLLKIELINDVSFREGEIVSTPLFYRTDSWINILSNKITALSRDTSKDIADIIFLSRNFEFSWHEVVASAKKKDAWVNEIDASKAIHDFDCLRLKDVLWINKLLFIERFDNDLKHIAKELLHGFKNSLVKNQYGNI